MARRARIQFAGAMYHVNFRGNERRPIFRDNADRHRLLDSLAERVERYEIRLYLYCLMANHVHLLLETPQANLSAFMASLETSYSAYFNRRHRRSGHLTQGRFKAPLVEGDRYLLKLSRYIHLNPVRTRALKNRPLREKVQLLRQYPWSSYRSYIGQAQALPFVDYGPLLRMMEGPRRLWPGRFRRFVELGLSETDEELREAMEGSSLAIGSEAFIEAMEQQSHRESCERYGAEDVSFRRIKPMHKPEQILYATAEYFGLPAEDLVIRRRNDVMKPVLAWLLSHHAGLTQRDIAQRMGLRTGAAVCHQLKRLHQDTSGTMQNAIKAVERKLNI